MFVVGKSSKHFTQNRQPSMVYLGSAAAPVGARTDSTATADMLSATAPASTERRGNHLEPDSSGMRISLSPSIQACVQVGWNRWRAVPSGAMMIRLGFTARHFPIGSP
ncbi:hypothetical protein [Sphaerisporangium rubeum]|uniref:hypothetical protein n=1 Tax=Sphaerisporangium rubeum TaxID=321317 RepID=UPI0031DE0FDB